MAQALRFTPQQPARTLGPADLPGEPGGGLWVDLLRGHLQPAPEHPWQEPLGQWMQRLHPLTTRTLRQEEPTRLAAAQERYVHVRLQAVTDGEVGSATRSTVTVDVVLGVGFALTVGAREIPAWRAVWDAYATGHRQADGVDFAIYHALAALVEAYRRAARRLTLAAEGIDQRLVRLSERHILSEIVGVRRQAIDLRQSLVSARDGLQLLAGGGGGEPVAPENRPYFADLRREVAEAVATVEATREAMGEAVEAFTSVQSTQMNRVMQVFTVLAVVIAPPMLVASIYGMNFRIPEYRWPHGYAYALGLIVTLIALAYGYVRGRHWL